MRCPCVLFCTLVSAVTGVRALFEVGLAAVPLLILAQRLGLGDVHATVRAANHGRWFIFALRLAGALGGAYIAAPNPDRGENDGDPEQQAKQTHGALFCLVEGGSLAKVKSAAQGAVASCALFPGQ